MTSEETSRPYRTIWRLAWPQALMMFFHFWIGFADVYVAGLINREVQASLGLITSCLFFLLIIAVSVANGSVAAISQSLGAGKEARAKRYVGLCLELALGVGLVFMFLGVGAKDLLLFLLRVPSDIHSIASDFLSIYAKLLPSYYILLITNAVFRARREVMVPTYTMLLITVVNVVADFGLGLGMWGMPNLGYHGLAWATFWSVTAGALLNLAVLHGKGMLRRSSFPPLCWVRKALPYLLRVAWPSGLMQILWQTGYLALFAITASLPQDNVAALAGMTAGIRVESLLFLPGMAFNMTASVLVGNYLGAGDPASAKRFGLRVWGVGVVCMTLLTVVVWQFVTPLAAFLSPDAGVRVQIEGYLFYNLLAIPFTMTSMTLGGALNGAGATLYNSAVFGGTVWGVRLPLAWLLGHVVLAASSGVWMAMLVSQMVQASCLFWVYMYKDWPRFALGAKKRPHGTVPATGLGAGTGLRK
ncbi:MATE family efflux transporter [Desulfocurvus sp. DL9XJH121]